MRGEGGRKPSLIAKTLIRRKKGNKGVNVLGGCAPCSSELFLHTIREKKRKKKEGKKGGEEGRRVRFFFSSRGRKRRWERLSLLLFITSPVSLAEEGKEGREGKKKEVAHTIPR